MALSSRSLALVTLLALTGPLSVSAQGDSLVSARNDSVSARLVNTDLRVAIQALGRYLDRPIVLAQIGEVRVTVETPRPVAKSDLPDLLRGIIRPYGLVMTAEPTFYTVGPPLPPAPAPVSTPQQGGAIQLFVLRVRHARAADVAATVNSLYGRASAMGEPGAPKPTLSESLRKNLLQQQDSQSRGPGDAVIGRVAELTGDVTIVPDPRTNSLLVRASRDDYELIRAAVEQVDVRPLQVLIEVVIAEVRKDRSLSFGLGVLVPRQRIAGTNTDISGSSTGLSAGDFALTVFHSGSFNLTATLNAAASRGDVTILSRPVLLAANNESAEILVGSQRPFVQVQRSLPTDAPSRDQVVQFKDVGTRLAVKPTISEDGYVMLHVTQEVNAATAEVAFDAPVISTRTIQTQLLVKDGRTAVLGGLAERQRDVTKAGIPILSEIPLLGGLFGRHVTHVAETELFLFLTPRVIRTDDDLEIVSDSVGDKTNKLRGRPEH